MIKSERMSDGDLGLALSLADRIERDVAMRDAEDLRTGFTLQNVCEEIAGVFEDRVRAGLPLDPDSRRRGARLLVLLVREISWWKSQALTISGGENAAEGKEDAGHADGGPDHRSEGAPGSRSAISS